MRSLGWGRKGVFGAARCPTCRGAAAGSQRGDGGHPWSRALAGRSDTVCGEPDGPHSDRLTEGLGGLGTPPGGGLPVQGWLAWNPCPVTGCVSDTGGGVVLGLGSKGARNGDFPKAPVPGTRPRAEVQGQRAGPAAGGGPTGRDARHRPGWVDSSGGRWRWGNVRLGWGAVPERERGTHKRRAREGVRTRAGHAGVGAGGQRRSRRERCAQRGAGAGRRGQCCGAAGHPRPAGPSTAPRYRDVAPRPK